MQKIQLGIAALFALAIVSLTPTLIKAETLPMGMRAHSDAWHDSVLDKDGATRIVLNLPATEVERWRGGLAAQRALESTAQPRRTARVAHSDDWDSKYLDRNVSGSIKSPVIDYQYPSLLQGCHAKADHRVQPNVVLAVASK